MAHAQRAYSVKAHAHSALTMKTDEGIIQLWGLSDSISDLNEFNVKARIYLDDLIGLGNVSCTGIKREGQTVIARCTNSRNQDIAFELLRRGLALTNKSVLSGTQYYDAYSNAERQARSDQSGLWGKLLAPQQSAQTTPQQTSQESLYAKDILLISGVFIGPILGMMIVATIMYFGLNRMISLQKRQIAMSQQREQELRDREKFVLAASLESEINTNRAKIDAFLVIYEDLLKNLKNPEKTPKYKQAGDIIHQRPSLNRAVYDTNLDRVDLLGPQLFGDLSDVYKKISSDPDYITLEPDTPLDQAIDKVQKIIQQANDMIKPLDQVGAALSMIIRERKKKMPQNSASSQI